MSKIKNLFLGKKYDTFLPLFFPQYYYYLFSFLSLCCWLVSHASSFARRQHHHSLCKDVFESWHGRERDRGPTALLCCFWRRRPLRPWEDPGTQKNHFAKTKTEDVDDDNTIAFLAMREPTHARMAREKEESGETNVNGGEKNAIARIVRRARFRRRR